MNAIARQSIEMVAEHLRGGDRIGRGHRILQVQRASVDGGDAVTLQVVSVVNGAPAGPETTLILAAGEIIRRILT